jgi:hypothetical protein
LFLLDQVLILEKVMVYNKQIQTMVLFEIDYFQFHVFYQIKDFNKKKMNSERKLDQMLFTHIEDYELHWQNQYHHLLFVH